jgi:hypothetical protein
MSASRRSAGASLRAEGGRYASSEYTLLSGAPGLTAPLESLEDYTRRAIAQAQAYGARVKADLKTPPNPELLRIKSWQYGMTNAGSEAEVDRAIQDKLFLRLQEFRSDYFTSETWTRCLGCFGQPQRWLSLGGELEAEGHRVDANAMFAAARWLAPAEVADGIAAMTQARSPWLPARFRDQPRPGFRELKFHERHWQAWDMKNYGRLDLPSLLEYESDINFSMRTRVYRSLGQEPHPAAIEALHEAAGDPHPFARAQALRSLGNTGDPTAITLLRRHLDDPDSEVRRTAAKAIQRIVGYWLYFGEWREIAQSPARALAVMRELIARGLPSFAYQFAWLCGDAEDRLQDELMEVSLRHDSGDRRTSYGYWFRDAEEYEQAVQSQPRHRDGLSAALESDDPKAQCLALDALDAAMFEELEPKVTGLIGVGGPISWHARRTLRRLGRGTQAQRRSLVGHEAAQLPTQGS